MGALLCLIMLFAGSLLAADQSVYWKEIDIRKPRLIDDQLYDFGHLAPGSTNFTVSGRFEGTEDGETTLVQDHVRFEVKPVKAPLSNSETLRFAAAGSLVEKMTPAHYMVLSPEVRKYVTPIPFQKRFKVKDVQLSVPLGTDVTIVAMERGSWFHAGIPFGGDIFQFKEIYRLTDRGIVKAVIPSKEELDERFAKREKAKIDFILKQAEGGSASFQYELGMKYLHGNGVTKSVDTAKEWLKKAASQGHKGAESELLKI